MPCMSQKFPIFPLFLPFFPPFFSPLFFPLFPLFFGGGILWFQQSWTQNSTGKFPKFAPWGVFIPIFLCFFEGFPSEFFIVPPSPPFFSFFFLLFFIFWRILKWILPFFPPIFPPREPLPRSVWVPAGIPRIFHPLGMKILPQIWDFWEFPLQDLRGSQNWTSPRRFFGIFLFLGGVFSDFLGGFSIPKKSWKIPFCLEKWEFLPRKTSREGVQAFLVCLKGVFS